MSLLSDWPISTYLRDEVFRLCAHTIFIKLFGLSSIRTLRKGNFFVQQLRHKAKYLPSSFGNSQSFFSGTVKFICFLINKAAVPIANSSGILFALSLKQDMNVIAFQKPFSKDVRATHMDYKHWNVQQSILVVKGTKLEIMAQNMQLCENNHYLYIRDEMVALFFDQYLSTMIFWRILKLFLGTGNKYLHRGNSLLQFRGYCFNNWYLKHRNNIFFR